MHPLLAVASCAIQSSAAHASSASQPRIEGRRAMSQLPQTPFCQCLPPCSGCRCTPLQAVLPISPLAAVDIHGYVSIVFVVRILMQDLVGRNTNCRAMR